MAYLYLAIAIFMEIIATTLLKMSDSLSRFIPSAACLISYVICYLAFAKALTKMNLGVAYATWCGVGIVATAVVSALLFKEKLSLTGVAGIAIIIFGCLLLNVFGSKS